MSLDKIVQIKSCQNLITSRILSPLDGYFTVLKTTFYEILEISKNENLRKKEQEIINPLNEALISIQQLLEDENLPVIDFNPIKKQLEDASKWANELKNMLFDWYQNENAQSIQKNLGLSLFNLDKLIKKFDLFKLYVDHIERTILEIEKTHNLLRNSIPSKTVNSDPANNQTLNSPEKKEKIEIVELPEEKIETKTIEHSKINQMPNPSEKLTLLERFHSLSPEIQAAIKTKINLTDPFSNNTLIVGIQRLRQDLLDGLELLKNCYSLLPLFWVLDNNLPEATFKRGKSSKKFNTFLWEQLNKRGSLDENACPYFAYADFSGSEGVKIEFKRDRDYNFFRANLSKITFTNTSNSVRSSFKEANLTEVVFLSTQLTCFDFQDANCAGAVFSGGIYDRVNFKGTHFSGAKFTETNLASAIISPDQLVNVAYLHNVTFPERWRSTQLPWSTQIALEAKVIEGWSVHEALNLIPTDRDGGYDYQKNINEISEEKRQYIKSTYQLIALLGISPLEWDTKLLNANPNKNPKPLYDKIQENFATTQALNQQIQKTVNQIINDYQNDWGFGRHWLRCLFFPPRKERTEQIQRLQKVALASSASDVENLNNSTNTLLAIYNEIRQEPNYVRSSLLSAIENNINIPLGNRRLAMLPL